MTCNQLCIYAAVCVCVCICCLTSTIKTKKHEEARCREGSELTTDELTNLTHRNDLTASVHRAGDSENSKTLRKYQKILVLSAEVDKNQYFLTKLSKKTMQRGHTTSEQSKCKIGVQSWIQRQRIGQDCIPLKSWCHQIRIYIFSYWYPSAKVSTNILHRYSIWSNLLLKKQERVPSCEQDSHCLGNLVNRPIFTHCETLTQVKPCANSTKVKSPRDHSNQVITEKSTVPVKTASP